MPYPPDVLATDKVDATSTPTDHAGHHNAVAGAINTVVTELTAEEVARAAADALLLAKGSNLADLASSSTARSNLGLGTSATRDVGTTAGTVAAGDDARLASEAAAWTAADTAVKASAMGACIYTAGAYPARPTDYAAVMFVGPTAPSEQTGADIWIAWTPPVPFAGTKATETDVAFAGLLYATALGGSKATETDSAFVGGFVSLFNVGGTQAIETDTAFAGVLYQTIAVGAMGTETDTAFAGAFVSGLTPITNAALAAITNAALAPITTA